MYTNSEGKKVDVKSLETTHLLNALTKAYREIWNSKDLEEYNKYTYNIDVLQAELSSRLDGFLIKKIDEEWK